ncbi:metal-dependent hydrolase [Kribbella sandramycini]|nr:endonuclease/exonuclease/phosphatase family protein [Kribbella sandramycini]NOL42797.1 metal-dependent hydrolase [Kribbella sandramycini]
MAPVTAQAAGQATTVKTLTFNIHHGQGTDGKLDLERTAKAIEASGAAVVGLQEVDKYFDARSNWVDQPAWLATRLGMTYVFAPNLDWDPLEPGKPRRQYGNLVLSKYPILESRNTPLPKVGTEEQRGLLEAVLDVNGTPVRFANTHLNNATPAERQQQATAVVNLLGAATEPTLLVGDLNAIPTTAEIKTLTARWKDTWTEVGIGLGFTSSVPLPTRRIDYQLHSPALKATAASVPSTFASDHYPVAATFTLG